MQTVAYVRAEPARSGFGANFVPLTIPPNYGLAFFVSCEGRIQGLKHIARKPWAPAFAGAHPPQRGCKKKRPRTGAVPLFAKTQLRDKLCVASCILLLQIVQKTAALVDQHQ